MERSTCMLKIFGEFRLMAPGLLFDESKNNEAHEQEADPDDPAEMTNRLSGVVHWQGLAGQA